MARFIQPGKIINYSNTTGADIAYGSEVVLASRIGVAESKIPAGTMGAVSLEGVYEMEAETTAAFAVGQKLCWDVANHRLTATEGDVAAGIAVEAKAETASVALVKL